MRNGKNTSISLKQVKRDAKIYRLAHPECSLRDAQDKIARDHGYRDFTHLRSERLKDEDSKQYVTSNVAADALAAAGLLIRRQLPGTLREGYFPTPETPFPAESAAQATCFPWVAYGASVQGRREGATVQVAAINTERLGDLPVAPILAAAPDLLRAMQEMLACPLVDAPWGGIGLAAPQALTQKVSDLILSLTGLSKLPFDLSLPQGKWKIRPESGFGYRITLESAEGVVSVALAVSDPSLPPTPDELRANSQLLGQAFRLLRALHRLVRGARWLDREHGTCLSVPAEVMEAAQDAFADAAGLAIPGKDYGDRVFMLPSQLAPRSHLYFRPPRYLADADLQAIARQLIDHLRGNRAILERYLTNNGFEQMKDIDETAATPPGRIVRGPVWDAADRRSDWVRDMDGLDKDEVLRAVLAAVVERVALDRVPDGDTLRKGALRALGQPDAQPLFRALALIDACRGGLAQAPGGSAELEFVVRVALDRFEDAHEDEGDQDD